jgi:NodT family efflux transporter outer membrane factor (OMF) lipoprotein
MMRRFPPRRLVVLAATVQLAGCALSTPPTQPEIQRQALPDTRVPYDWVARSGGGAVAANWLASFNDPQLVALVAEAIAHNPDLAVAAARVAAAQGAAAVAASALLPQIGGQAGGRATWDISHGDAQPSGIALIGISWEPDVWGRLRAQRGAAAANAQAAALDAAWARESIAATTATLWYLGTEARQMVALSQQAVAIYSDLLALVRQRRAAGRDSDLDVVDVRAKLETAQSALADAQASEAQIRRALEILLGRYPSAELASALNPPPLPPPVPAGLPSSLLGRRPDIVAAQARVLAAFRQQEAARLALLPSFALSGVGGALGDTLMSVLGLNPWLASAAIGMTVPIYTGGRLQAEVQIATAAQQQAVALYGAAALRAFAEVENSLATETTLATRMAHETPALADRTDAVRIALVQYKAGRIDLLWVAQLQTAQLTTLQSVTQLRSAQRINRIRLYQALGGSFAPAVPS